MTINVARQVFTKARPELVIEKIFDWDDKHYVVVAMPNDGKDYFDPYYGLDKITGEITTFSPGSNLEKFLDLMDEEED